MEKLRMDSINGSPIVEYRQIDGLIQRRALYSAEGKYYIAAGDVVRSIEVDDGTGWENVTTVVIREQMMLDGPVAKWLWGLAGEEAKSAEE